MSETAEDLTSFPNQRRCGLNFSDSLTHMVTIIMAWVSRHELANRNQVKCFLANTNSLATVNVLAVVA